MTEKTIRIRPATVRDTAAMLDITRSVWEGHDYVPSVWDSWLADGSGYLAVVAVDARVAGFQHIQVQEDGTGWMEGIRVREDTQTRGLGYALLADGLRWAREQGLPRVRLCTYGGNPASNRIATKAGLTEIARIKILSADSTAGDDCAGCQCRVATPADFDEIVHFVQGHAGDAPVYTEGWTAHTLDHRRLRLLLATNAVLVAGGSAIEGVAIATSTVDRPSLRLGFIAGTERAVEALARSLTHRAVVAGLDRVVCYAPIADETEAALTRAGYMWRDGDEMVLYELDLRVECSGASKPM
jgi:GNAT superfamily N-acetyltransferase